jgi:hypothetical protein
MRRFPIPSLLALLLASHASALTYAVSASLDGLQETPPNASPATGTLTGSYDDGTNILLWSGSFSGLTGTTTNAHFHGPAAPGVGPAGVQVGMTGATGDVFPLGVTSGSYSGSATISAAQETDLLAGLWYVNIHSTTFGGGEIRGQVYLTVVPEPPTVALLLLGLFGLARAGRRRS